MLPIISLVILLVGRSVADFASPPSIELAASQTNRRKPFKLELRKVRPANACGGKVSSPPQYLGYGDIITHDVNAAVSWDLYENRLSLLEQGAMRTEGQWAPHEKEGAIAAFSTPLNQYRFTISNGKLALAESNAGSNPRAFCRSSADGMVFIRSQGSEGYCQPVELVIVYVPCGCEDDKRPSSSLSPSTLPNTPPLSHPRSALSTLPTHGRFSHRHHPPFSTLLSDFHDVQPQSPTTSFVDQRSRTHESLPFSNPIQEYSHSISHPFFSIPRMDHTHSSVDPDPSQPWLAITRLSNAIILTSTSLPDPDSAIYHDSSPLSVILINHHGPSFLKSPVYHHGPSLVAPALGGKTPQARPSVPLPLIRRPSVCSSKVATALCCQVSVFGITTTGCMPRKFSLVHDMASTNN